MSRSKDAWLYFFSIVTPVALFFACKMVGEVDKSLLYLLYLAPVFGSAFLGGVLPGLIAFCTSLSLIIYSTSQPIELQLAEITVFSGLSIFICFVLGFLNEHYWRFRSLANASRTSEHKFKSMVEEVKEYAIFLVEPDGTIASWNKGVEAILGYSEDEFIGSDVRMIYTEEDLAAGIMDQEFDGAKRFNQFPDECWHVRKDGSRFHASGVVTAIYDSRGAVIALCKVMKDNTERRKHEARYRLAVEAAPCGILMTNEQGTILSVNAELLRIFGYARAELIGHSAEMLIPPAHRGQFGLMLEEFFALGITRPMGKANTLHGLTKDGKEVPIEIGVTPIETDEGLILIASMVDISERLKISDAYRDEATKFEMLANNVPQFVWMADGEGNISWYNKRWYEYTGSSLDEMRGWGWRKVHHPEHVARVVARIQESFTTGLPWEDTFPLRAKNGTYRWFLSQALPMYDASGKIDRWLGTNTDITELRQAQQNLEAAKEELEHSNQDLEHFAAIVSHDLRNPLNNISGFIELHKMRQRTEDTSLLDRALKNVKQMDRLILHLLEFSKTTLRKAELKPFDSNEALIAALDGLTQRVEEANPLINAKTLPHVYSDKVLMTSLFQNLISNALKYKSERLLKIEIWADERPDDFLFAVRDNGIGIDPKNAKNIFEVFKRIEPDRAEGAGIGLTTCKRVIEHLGGRIWVESEKNKGSTFYFTIPKREAASMPLASNA